jgi:hypothetical protein
MVLDPLFAKKMPKLFGHLSIAALRRCHLRQFGANFGARASHSRIC